MGDAADDVGARRGGRRPRAPAARPRVKKLDLAAVAALADADAERSGDDTARERAPAATRPAPSPPPSRTAGTGAAFAAFAAALVLVAALALAALVAAAAAHREVSALREADAAALLRADALAAEVAQLRRAVAEARRPPPADGTGMPDLAASALGGRVVATSPTLLPRALDALQRAAAALPGLRAPADRFLLSPGVEAGRCLPLRAPGAWAVLRLARPVRPRAVSYEHVHRALAPGAPSVPRELEVFGARGVAALRAGGGARLGGGAYDAAAGPALQTLALANSTEVVDHVRVAFRAAPGAGHVCVYRVRVHGE
jgi:hypothetical protein